MRLPDKIFVALGVSLTVAACGVGNGEAVASTPPPAEGPAADYPMVIGDPFVVNGVRYTPADVMNYDLVGHAVLDQDGGSRITGSNRTLPLPSYVEVTSLDSGRTILVRLERRGPMAGDGLVGLSSGALSQLGIAPDAPVRVRRVNPPEQERAMLRRGETVPERMATPAPLLEVLRRKLPSTGSMSLAKTDTPLPKLVPPVSTSAPDARGDSRPAPQEAAPPAPPKAPVKPSEPAPPRKPASSAPPKPAVSPGKGTLAVQAGAFAVEANAKSVAQKIGGTISRQGKLFVVRTGPFANQNEASASLAKVKAAGYSSARIYRVE